MKTVAEHYGKSSGADPATKDLMQFLSIHSKGHVLQIGMENGAATAALLYGVETRGGHVWTINTSSADASPFADHPQWTMIEENPEHIGGIRGLGVPEELDLLYLKSEATMVTAFMLLRIYGQTIKTSGLIVVADVKKHPAIHQACEEYAKSYGMKYHVRPSEGDLGVIFFSENKEALNV